MKKLFCLLLALALTLGLTGCSSDKPETLTGEWHALGMATYAELTEKRPESLDDLPSEFRDFPEGTQVTFRALNESLTLIEMSYTVSNILMLARKGDSGTWTLYGLDLPGETHYFGGNRIGGTLECWHSDVYRWFEEDQLRLLIRRGSVIDDGWHLK